MDKISTMVGCMVVVRRMRRKGTELVMGAESPAGQR